MGYIPSQLQPLKSNSMYCFSTNQTDGFLYLNLKTTIRYTMAIKVSDLCKFARIISEKHILFHIWYLLLMVIMPQDSCVLETFLDVL